MIKWLSSVRIGQEIEKERTIAKYAKKKKI
jgi:hypothetical protein